jgi:DinB superfamily
MPSISLDTAGAIELAPTLSHRSRRRYRDNLGCSRHDESMTADWTHELFNQFDLQWNLGHGPSLETLTDEEYLWEPVPGCWSIRPTGPGGRGEFEQAWPDPEPAPVTTIAWRLSHLAVGVFGLRASHYFGDGSLTHDNAERPLTAKEGVAYFTEQALQWRSHTERLDEAGLARPVGEPEHAPVLSLVIRVNREALHHLAEVSLLRDLYRATGGARLA